MVGESEVVVGGEIEQFAPANLHARALRRINAAQFAKEVLLADRVKLVVQLRFEVGHSAQPSKQAHVHGAMRLSNWNSCAEMFCVPARNTMNRATSSTELIRPSAFAAANCCISSGDRELVIFVGTTPGSTA